MRDLKDKQYAWPFSIKLKQFFLFSFKSIYKTAWRARNSLFLDSGTKARLLTLIALRLFCSAAV